MLLAPKQLLDIHKVDKNAFANTVFYKFNGNRGICLATVDEPMNLEEAIAFAEKCEAENAPRAVDERPAAGSAFASSQAE